MVNVGFKYGKPLSLKIVTLYNLMIQQLSKQDHYDFGLRAIKSVLTCAGRFKREKSSEVGKEVDQDESFAEQIILMRAIRVMNLPKFVAEDQPLFEALFNDLFTRIEIKVDPYSYLGCSIFIIFLIRKSLMLH